MKRLILPALAALTLAACETPEPMAYQPAGGPHGMGFSETRIEPGRYRVTFHASAGAPAVQAQDYALRRAADLALADGYDWFRAYGRNLGWIGGSGPQIGLGVGGASFGRRGAMGGSVGTGFSLGGGPAPVATLEVVMGKGPKPQDRDAYDARGVQRSINGPA